jgi:hypothetical protein
MIHRIKPYVSTLTLPPSSLLFWGPLHCANTLFWEMNCIYTATITVTLVWHHFRKPIGVYFPCFLSLHLLGLLCEMSLNKSCQIQELEDYIFGNIHSLKQSMLLLILQGPFQSSDMLAVAVSFLSPTACAVSHLNVCYYNQPFVNISTNSLTPTARQHQCDI